MQLLLLLFPALRAAVLFPSGIVGDSLLNENINAAGIDAAFFYGNNVVEVDAVGIKK